MEHISIDTSRTVTVGRKCDNMIIKEIHVCNFRSILDEKLPCENLTSLIGPNGSGKSSFLRALELFYNPNAKFTVDDFYDRDNEREITITIAYTNLNENEIELFEKYVANESLIIEKVLTWPPSKGNQKYYGNRLQNPDFDSFRTATGGRLKAEYNNLLSTYCNLPPYKNKEEAEIALQNWEGEHPDKCIRKRDEGQFFGFKEIGEAHLERYTKYIYVPAVRDASLDAEEGKDSSLKEIMDLVVRSRLLHKKEIIAFKTETAEKYRQLMDPSNIKELQTLEKDLSDTLNTYILGAGVKLEWQTEDINILPPKANVRLIEDGYPSSVERTGHGSQRVYIVTMLQNLAIAQSPEQIDETETEGVESLSKASESMPNLIFGIEEPELYQHPSRQRHLFNILKKLAESGINGESITTQIIYTTHSPLFVDIKQFNKIRIIHKDVFNSCKPGITKVVCTKLDDVARVIEVAEGKEEGTFCGKTLEPRLQTLMTPWLNEGFFANVVVLVEGEEDRAVILGMSNYLGYEFEKMGISVIPCMGKSNLDRPTAIFQKLRIPVYTIFDSDKGEKNENPKNNHRLLRLFGQTEEDWPHRVSDNFACFEKTLTNTFAEELGQDFYNSSLDECCVNYGYTKRGQACKNPKVISDIVTYAISEGKSCETINEIIHKILSLKSSGNCAYTSIPK